VATVKLHIQDTIQNKHIDITVDTGVTFRAVVQGIIQRERLPQVSENGKRIRYELFRPELSSVLKPAEFVGSIRLRKDEILELRSREEIRGIP